MISLSEQQTLDIAKEFAFTLNGGEVIELVGDLGSGKTLFVRGIAEAFGCSTRVKSPTFTIMNEYPTHSSDTVIRKIIHMDLYRFSDKSQLLALELGDVMADDTVVCIEWPDIFGESPFHPTHRIRLNHIDENSRDIEIEKI
jgi:tRNA threonylcarbamoyladenosine biosynthesis protein TsaE